MSHILSKTETSSGQTDTADSSWLRFIKVNVGRSSSTIEFDQKIEVRIEQMWVKRPR